MAIQKWEYLREKISRNEYGDEKMRARGEEGWELVSVVIIKGEGGAHGYFKRPKN
tara:strand:- start:362 stop:526 length:165 start_codon:yes stop_codon:yes gene_type:complete